MALYVVVRRRDDAYVWHSGAEAFQAWSDEAVGAYGVALTDAGGDLYLGDWPGAMPAGRYRAIYYQQAGAAPTNDDLLLAADEVFWNGQTISTPAQVELDSSALTDLPAVKRHLHLDGGEHDALLTDLINQVSALIERLCGRQFRLRTREERHRPLRGRFVFLRHYPVAQVHAVTRDAQAVRYRLRTGSGMLELLDRGGGDVVMNYDAGFDPLPADLVLTCHEMVAEAFARSRRDNSVRSERLGEYAVAPADAVTISESQRARLRHYQAITLGQETQT